MQQPKTDFDDKSRVLPLQSLKCETGFENGQWTEARKNFEENISESLKNLLSRSPVEATVSLLYTLGVPERINKL